MPSALHLDGRYKPSDDVVAREIEGELIIVPLTAGIGDMEDELFTLNETGRAIWNLLDGAQSLQDIAAKLSSEFDAPPDKIRDDVVGFTAELLRRRMIVEVSA